MKNINAFYLFIILSTFFYSSPLEAQNLKGEANYKMYSIFDFSKVFKDSAELKVQEDTEEVLSVLKNQSLRDKMVDCKLQFDNNKTLFSFEVEMEIEGTSSFDLAHITAKTTGDIYMDLENGEVLSQKEFEGERLLIKKNLKDYEWKLENKTKKIGTYICYKATTFERVYRKNGKHKKKRIEAWYAPGLTINGGPFGYGGLPGLILELKDGSNFIFHLDEISFGKISKRKIEKPTKGKIITPDEYEILEMEALERFIKEVGGD